MVFHGLTGLSYIFRWSSYWVFTTATRNIDESRVSNKLKALKISFFILWVLYILLFVFSSLLSRNRIIYELSISVTFLYWGSAVALIGVSSYFLWILKYHKYSFYLRKQATIRTYTILIGVWLLVRGLTTVYDLSMQIINVAEGSVAQAVWDIMMMGCYFTEIIPSLIITYILWKSYKEKKHELEIKSSSKHTDQSTQSFVKSSHNTTADNMLLAETVPTTQNNMSLVKVTCSHSKLLLESVYDSALYTDSGEGDMSYGEMTPCTYY